MKLKPTPQAEALKAGLVLLAFPVIIILVARGVLLWT